MSGRPKRPKRATEGSNRGWDEGSGVGWGEGFGFGRAGTMRLTWKASPRHGCVANSKGLWSDVCVGGVRQRPTLVRPKATGELCDTMSPERRLPLPPPSRRGHTVEDLKTRRKFAIVPFSVRSPWPVETRSGKSRHPAVMRCHGGSPSKLPRFEQCCCLAGHFSGRALIGNDSF